jgi:hypothetical protein
MTDIVDRAELAPASGRSGCTSACQESASLSIWQIHAACPNTTTTRAGWVACSRRTAEVPITADRWPAKSLSHNIQTKKPHPDATLALPRSATRVLGGKKNGRCSQSGAHPRQRLPSRPLASAACSAGCKEAGFFVTSRMHSVGLGPA